MIKIFKYLKSSFSVILFIVVLLVIQAVCDLSLPEYTSKIINVGVQQNGIENTLPEVISEKKLNNLSLFLAVEEQELILAHYKLLTAGNNDYIADYPLLKEENLYVLNTKDKELIAELARAFKLPLVIDAGINSPEASQLGFDIPENVSPYTILGAMSQSELEVLLTKINTTISEYPDTIITSSAIMNIKSEYEHIGVDIEKMQTNYILISGAKMLGIALLIMVIAIVVSLLGSKLAAKLAKIVREKVFKRVTTLSKTEIKQYGVASLITRTTNDVQQVQQVIVMMLRVVFYAPIIAIGGILKTTTTSNSMGWIIGIAVGTLIAVMLFLFMVVFPKFKTMQKLIDKLNLVSREILNGLPVIRAFNNERHEEQRFNKSNKDLTKTMLFVTRVMAVMMPLMTILMNVVCVAIVWKGAYSIDDGSMQVGDMMAYIQYTMQIIMAFLIISMMSILLPRAGVSAKRIIEVIETDSTIKEPSEEVPLDTTKKGIVEFKNVCFRYPDALEDVLTDISFKATPGTITAFIGSTGSGKSTVINLIPRFYDATAGNITIDGVDIKDINTKTLRQKIGYVPQKGMLFKGDIESNIKYGNSTLTDEDMEKALSIAQATSFVAKLDKGYKSEISQGGTNVSGGQRQRLSIARAIALNPDIYIFDDSFSALDFKTDLNLRKDLKQVTDNSTVFIVAQRINTIMNAEQIIVLDEGKVVGIGNHKALMESCKVYQEIALSQLSEEELKNA